MCLIVVAIITCCLWVFVVAAAAAASAAVIFIAVFNVVKYDRTCVCTQLNYVTVHTINSPNVRYVVMDSGMYSLINLS